MEIITFCMFFLNKKRTETTLNLICLLSKTRNWSNYIDCSIITLFVSMNLIIEQPRDNEVYAM